MKKLCIALLVAQSALICLAGYGVYLMHSVHSIMESVAFDAERACNAARECERQLSDIKLTVKLGFDNAERELENIKREVKYAK